MRRTLNAFAVAVAMSSVAAAASAQSLQQRINQIRRSAARANVVADVPAPGQRATIEFRLHDIVDPVVIEEVSAKRVFEWWSLTTGIPLVVDWASMEAAGIDPQTPINLNLRTVPAGQLLALIMRRLGPETALLYETTPWYVQIMTREQALKRTVLRVYVIEDLLMDIPNFADAPVFDVNQALSNTNSGGSSSAQGVARAATGIFGQNQPQAEPPKTKQERGQEMADLIRETIEPEIWVANGGRYASVKYFHGRLIVNAPLFVHAQIGIPSAGSGVSAGGGRHYYVSRPTGAATAPAARQRRAAGAGINPVAARPVAAVAKD